MVHVRRTPPPVKLLRNLTQPAQHVGQPKPKDTIALRLLLPEVRPALRAPVLMPGRAAARGVLERRRARPQPLPRGRELPVPRKQAEALRRRDDQAPLFINLARLRALAGFCSLVCRRGGGAAGSGNLRLLHHLKVRDAAERPEVELVRERDGQVRKLRGKAHELPQAGHHRGLQAFVAAQLRQPDEPGELRAAYLDSLRRRRTARVDGQLA